MIDSLLSLNAFAKGPSLPNNMNEKRRGHDGPLAKAFNDEARDHVSSEIARLFCSAGLPFNVARNPYLSVHLLMRQKLLSRAIFLQAIIS